jgi:sulfur carrier protein ThiS
MLRVRVVPRGKLAANSRLSADGLDVALQDGMRVRDLLVELGLFDEEVRRVVVNGRRGRLDQTLRRNDMVELFS